MIELRRIIWYSVVLFGLGESLKDVRVSIPVAVKRGDKAVLACRYDLEDDSLYSIKWYKGRNEFYRYTPKDNPSMKLFPLHNIDVLETGSNATQVTLRHVELSVSGRYSCEVSADAPSFHTALVSGDMDIVEVPAGVPVILGLKQRYRVGDVLWGNCTSSWSSPAANLSWVINGEPAPSNHTISYPVLKEKGGDKETSRLGLRLPVTSHLFAGGRLKVRCSASIHAIYWQSTEKSVEEEKPKGALVGGGDPQLMRPLTTDQPAGFKYGDQDTDLNEIVDIKSISGQVTVRGSIIWPYTLVASTLALVVVR